MSESFLEEYFKNIAQKLKDIQHTDAQKAFYRVADPYNLAEFDDAVKSMSKPICLLLEMGTGELGEWDSQSDTCQIGLHLLVKATEKYSDIHPARANAKSILLKIVSKMRIDAQENYEGAEPVIGPLKAQTISFNTKVKFTDMTAIDGNWYGKSFWFELTAPLDVRHNQEDWLN